ncbi:MAG: hypothetical protein IJ557_06465 [Bacteroidaceae bacterium]|nr:hypothetical protein [Bacteroidaceae bacterium]
MINKYKNVIIDKVYQYLDWEQSKEVRTIAFVCNNTKRVVDLNDNEFLLYRDYVRSVLPLFVLHENFDDEDDRGWSKIAELFFNIQNCERQEFVEKYWDVKARLKEQMDLLPIISLELSKFFALYHQIYIRNYYLSQQLEGYSSQQIFNDYLNKVNVPRKIWSMFNAQANMVQPNPLKYIDASLQSDKGLVFDKILLDYVFRKIEDHKIPLTYDFIQQLRATGREIAFQMLVSMLDFVEDKTTDPKYRQFELLVWGSNTPFNPLFQLISLNADDFNLKEARQKYNWKEVLNLLSIEELDIDVDNSDIIFSKDDNSENENFIRVPSSKYKGGVNQKLQDKMLYKCLTYLYNKLSEEYIAFESPCKDAFIYRFSGFNRPDDLKIKWIGKNAFLGKLIRCLYEDKNRGVVPSYKKIATYMGVKANIAAAGQIQKGTKDTKEIVDLLTDCGFTNVDVFEDPYTR